MNIDWRDVWHCLKHAWEDSLKSEKNFTSSFHTCEQCKNYKEQTTMLIRDIDHLVLFKDKRGQIGMKMPNTVGYCGPNKNATPKEIVAWLFPMRGFDIVSAICCEDVVIIENIQECTNVEAWKNWKFS